MSKFGKLLQQVESLMGERAMVALGMTGEPGLLGNQEGSWSSADVQDPRMPYTVQGLGMDPSWDFDGAQPGNTHVFTGWNGPVEMDTPDNDDDDDDDLNVDMMLSQYGTDDEDN